MEVGLTGAIPLDSPPARNTARREPTGEGFAAAIAAEVGGDQALLERAEGLIGTRIRAPEGGCGCDALIDAAARPNDRQAMNPRPSPTESVGRGVGPTAQGRSAPAPGAILLLSGEGDLGEHLHQAIMRSASEMITATRAGLVEVVSIPWDRITQTR